MRALLVSLALIVFASTRALAQCDPVPSWASGRDGSCNLQVPGGGSYGTITFNAERSEEVSTGNSYRMSCSTAGNIAGGCPTCNSVEFNLTLDNYLSGTQHEKDVSLWNTNSNSKYVLLKDSLFTHGWVCGGGTWSGPNGNSCSGQSESKHTDVMQVIGIPNDNGWFVVQGTDLLEADKQIGIWQQPDFTRGISDGSQSGSCPDSGGMGGMVWQDVEFGNKDPNYEDDCNDRHNGGLSTCGSGNQFVVKNDATDNFGDIWLIGVQRHGAKFRVMGGPNTSTGAPPKIIVIGGGGGTNGWPGPLGPGPRAGPGLSSPPNGDIGIKYNEVGVTDTRVYWYDSIESALAGGHTRPPFIQLSPVGWATPPSGSLAVTLACSPDSGDAPLVGVVCTATVTGTGTGPDYQASLECKGDGHVDSSLTRDDDTPPVANFVFASSACNADYASAGTYTAKVTLYDKANNGSGGAEVATATATDSIFVSTAATFAFASPAPSAAPSEINDGEDVTWTWSTVNQVGAPSCSLDKDGNGSYETSPVTSPYTAAVTGTDGVTINTKIQCTSAGASPGTITSASLPVLVEDSVAVTGVDLYDNYPNTLTGTPDEGLLIEDFHNSGLIDLRSMPKRCIVDSTSLSTNTTCTSNADCAGGETCDYCLAFRINGNSALTSDLGSVGMTLFSNGEYKKKRVTGTVGDGCTFLPGESECGTCSGDNSWSWSENNWPFGWPEEPGIAGPNGPHCAAELRTPGTHVLLVAPFEDDNCGGDQGDWMVLPFTVHPSNRGHFGASR